MVIYSECNKGICENFGDDLHHWHQCTLNLHMEFVCSPSRPLGEHH